MLTNESDGSISESDGQILQSSQYRKSRSLMKALVVTSDIILIISLILLISYFGMINWLRSDQNTIVGVVIAVLIFAYTIMIKTSRLFGGNVNGILPEQI